MSDRPQIKSIAEVGEDARYERNNFLLHQGANEIELAIEACQADIALHKDESKSRRALTQKGLDVPKRWQIAPGVFEKIVGRMLKLIDRKNFVIELADKLYETYCRDHGWGLDAKPIDPNAEIIKPEVPSVQPAAMPDLKVVKSETSATSAEEQPELPEFDIDEIAKTATTEILKAFEKKEEKDVFLNVNQIEYNGK